MCKLKLGPFIRWKTIENRPKTKQKAKSLNENNRFRAISWLTFRRMAHKNYNPQHQTKKHELKCMATENA